MGRLKRFTEYLNESRETVGVGHINKRFELQIKGYDKMEMMAELFCDDGSVLMIVRPTKSDDLDTFNKKDFLEKLSGYITSNTSKGVKMVNDHDRGGLLMEFTGEHFKPMLDHLFD